MRVCMLEMRMRASNVTHVRPFPPPLSAEAFASMLQENSDRLSTTLAHSELPSLYASPRAQVQLMAEEDAGTVRLFAGKKVGC